MLETLAGTLPFASLNDALGGYNIFGLVAIVAIVFGTVSSVLNRRQKEATKRDIAAYVAEGSINPDDARKIIESKEADD